MDVALFEYMRQCHVLCRQICPALDCITLTAIVTFDSVCMQGAQRWVPKWRPSLPAAHLPQHDAMTRPDSSPGAEAPRAMSPIPEADMVADDIQHGQISRPASDSAANAPATSLPSESPTSQLLAIRAAALAATVSMLGDSSSAAATSAPEASGAPAADTLPPVNIAVTRLAAPSGYCEEHEQAELEESDELCQADNAPGISTLASCRPSFSRCLAVSAWL